jgi:hypothetical protein
MILDRYNAPPFGGSRVSLCARVAKLVDAADSKSAGSNTVPVQVRPLVPSLLETQNLLIINRFFCISQKISLPSLGVVLVSLVLLSF